MIAVGVCLPVPALAATGLSVPLPNVVERIAAALVPWADPLALDTGQLVRGVSGSIIPAAAEASPSRERTLVPGAITTTTSPERTSGPAARPGTPASSRVAVGGVAAVARVPTARPGGTDRFETGAPSSGADAAVTAPEAGTRPADPATNPADPPTKQADPPAKQAPAPTGATEPKPKPGPARNTNPHSPPVSIPNVPHPTVPNPTGSNPPVPTPRVPTPAAPAAPVTPAAPPAGPPDDVGSVTDPAGATTGSGHAPRGNAPAVPSGLGK